MTGPHQPPLPASRAIDVARLVDTGPFGYVTAGPSDVIDGINSTLCDLLGRESSTIVGQQTFQDLLAPGDRIYYDTHIRPMLSMRHEASEIAVQLVCADGSRLPVLLNSLLHVDDNGDQRVETVVIDATERRRYEQELLHERQLAEASEARLQVMYDVVSGLAGAASVQAIVDVVTDRGERTIAGAACSVWLFDAAMQSVNRTSDVAGTNAVYTLKGDGPALVALARGDLLEIENTEQSADDYPLVCEMLQSAGYVSAAVAPLLTHGGLHGVINYGFDEPHVFNESERRALMSLAEQAEQALQRAWSLEAERRSRDRLESLFQFSTRLSGALTVDDVLQVMAGDSIDLLGASSVRLAVLSEDRMSVRFVRGAGREADETRLDIDTNALACEVIRTGEAIVLDSSEDIRRQYPDSPLLENDDIGSAIAVPLVGTLGVLGAWVLGYLESGPPDADDMTMLHLFAEQAGQATSRATFHQSEAAARAMADVRLAISESLNAAITAEDVAEAIMDRGRTAFDAAQLAVYLTDPSLPSSLELIASVGFVEGPPAHDAPDSRFGAMLRAVVKKRAPLHLEGSTLRTIGGDALAAQSWGAMVLLPMAVSGDLMGLLLVGFDDSTAMTPGTRAALAGLTAEAGAAIGRARRYELEHEVAITLQTSLLPTEFAQLDGWTTSARYEPGSEHLVVGGDLFDIIRTPNDGIFVIVGDVVGHGLHAAASMGQLRSAARALALVSTGPLEVLQGLEAFARITPGAMWATVACVSIEPNGDGLYACAGHPYPIVVRDGGETELLMGGRSPLLGLGEKPPQVASFHMDLGDCLVLYTDGLIELNDQKIDEGIQRLRRVVTGVYSSGAPLDADDVVDTVLDGSPSRDDIVVVCVTRAAR